MKSAERFTITRAQLLAAVEGLEAIIEDTECLIESLENPREPLTGGEQKQLVSEQVRLRNFRRCQKELRQLKPAAQVIDEIKDRPKGDQPVVISHRQLMEAINAYVLAIENVEGMVDGINDPAKNTADENKDLARHRRHLKNLQSQQKALKALR